MRQFWLKRAEKYYQKNKWHIVADLSFLALIILLGLALILIRVWRPENVIDFKTTITSGPVASGSIVEFNIDYQAKQTLKNNSLSFNWPQNFVLESVEPAANFNIETNTIGLNNLESGANGKIKIRGRVLGAISERQDLFFFFNCDRCANGLVESYVYNIESSNLKTSWQLPETIYQGVEFKAKIELENQADTKFSDVKIKTVDDFSLVDKIEPFDLAPGEKKEVEITLLSDKPQANLRLQFFVDIDNNDRLQAELAESVHLTENKFQVVLAPENMAVKNGEEVVYGLHYQNNNPQLIDNLSFSFLGNLNSVRLISATPNLIAKGDSWKVQGNLPYQAEGNARFAVVFKDKNELEQKLSLVAMADYSLSDQELRYRVEAPAVKFFSRLKIKSGAYYYSSQGDQLGVGPLPPQVGMATNYWIFWELNNRGNDLSNFTLSADLPAGVIWSGKKTMSAGTLRYNDSTGRVVWSLDQITKEASSGDYYLGFEVSLFPEAKDLGQLMILAKNLNYQALDSFVGADISGSLNDLSTNLDADLLGRGRGQVVGQE